MSPPVLPSQSDRAALQRAGLALLHPRGSRGQVCTARAARDGHDWDEGLVAPSSRAISDLLASAEVEFVGMHRFTGRRHSARVTGISNGFLDLDYYKEGLPHADATAEDVAAILIGACEAAQVPFPSFIQDSGRGAYAIWTFQGMSGQALARWQTAMRNLRGPKLDEDGNLPVRWGAAEPAVAAFEARMLPLWRTLRDLGLDRGAIDPARVLRLVGAVNPKTGRMARIAWPSSIQDVERANFDAWCDALMPYSREEMRALRAEREAWKAENPGHVRHDRATRRVSGSKWAWVYGDLMRILNHRGAAWFAANHKRDWWAFIAATAISFIEGGMAEEWAERLAPMVGLPVREVAAALSGVERGMQAHADGERREWQGQDRPAFYDFSYATIVDRLEITEDEAREAGLRVLVPGGATPLTAAERQRALRDRRAPNRVTRNDQAETRRAQGHFALALRAAGVTVEACAQLYDRSRSWMCQALAEAEAEPDVPGLIYFRELFALRPSIVGEPDAVEAVPQPVAVAVDVAQDEIETVHDVSRRIVVSDPILPPAAPALAPGEVRVKRFTPFYSEYRTATKAWSEFRERQGSIWVIHREDLTLDVAPRPAQQALSRPLTAAEEAIHLGIIGQIALDAATARRSLSRASGRPAKRPVALAPLDLEYRAQLYREASSR